VDCPLWLGRGFASERFDGDLRDAAQLLDPERDLPEVLREMEAEVLPDRENRNHGRERAHRDRRRSRHTSLGPPRLSALCSVRLRHNLLHELKHIALAATPGGASLSQNSFF
jgi:hypothetical protein